MCAHIYLCTPIGIYATYICIYVYVTYIDDILSDNTIKLNGN